MSFTAVTKVPLPAHVPPDAAIALLQTYRPLIEANPHLVSYERRSVGIHEVVDDPFFRDDGQRLQAFNVYQRITIIPGVGSWATKDVVVTGVFQSVKNGCRCRADASGGVTVRSRYEIRRRGEVPDITSKPEAPPGPRDGDHELVEIAEVSCGALVKPFVRHSFSTSHNEILQRVMDEVVQKYDAQQTGAISGYERTKPSAPSNYDPPRPATTYEVQTHYATQDYGAPRPASNYEVQSTLPSSYSAQPPPPVQSYNAQQQQGRAPPVSQPPGNFI
ncbi:hypothetical protein B0T14DRAFT_497361 [Immersiella caudata]|uniref:DUF7053 domain-containing protein n=1 Tax=Immersiella caudata TaxID=314043 RepID=A0AA39WSS4_9PEZI|nr:hypothetical protein B0T14DRAFT_497361 [Immersiella caudata]